jgi:polyisoprenyl-teichoic acid--peptidoglycan teichoic acid transferase
VSPELPKVGASFLKRAALACLAIVLMCGVAVTSAGLLELDDVLAEINKGGRDLEEVETVVDRAEAGKARTFMILGTDERLGVDKGNEAHSDTIILVRLDPDKEAIAVMSIPRDLLVDIPGYSERDRINTAFTLGGPKLAVRTVRQLLERSGRDFPIHHVVSVSFTGFRRAVDYIGCVYADVDRRYFNDNSAGQNYATIDIQPGYQKICGSDALDYVRYRHSDNDLIRAARQQDFLRQIKAQDGVRNLMDLDDRYRIIRAFRRYFRSDKKLRESKEVLSVLKLLLFTGQNEIQEVGFKLDLSKESPSYLYTNRRLIRETVDQFLDTEASAAPRQRQAASDADREFTRRANSRDRNRPSEIRGLEDARAEGENMAVLGASEIGFPFYYPTLRATGSRYAATEPRTYRMRDLRGKRHDAYRLVLYNGRIGEYYGVQGTTWKRPPILDNPAETERIGNRTFRIYKTGRKVRIVAWETPRGVYWVTNTLNQALNRQKMLGIAQSLRRLGA